MQYTSSRVKIFATLPFKEGCDLSSQTTTFYEAEKNIVPIAGQLYEASVGLAEELWKEFTKELVPVG